MDTLTIVILCIVGIILNVYAMKRIADDEPTGAMGMGMMVFAVFIPFLIVALFLLGWVVKKVMQLVKWIKG